MTAAIQELTWGCKIDDTWPAFDVVTACGMHTFLTELAFNCDKPQYMCTPVLSRETCSRLCLYVCRHADVMYIQEAVQDLVKTLGNLSSRNTTVYIAHGRNCGAESKFCHELERKGWTVSEVGVCEQHPKFHAPDVKVLRCQR